MKNRRLTANGDFYFRFCRSRQQTLDVLAARAGIELAHTALQGDLYL